MYKKVKDFHRGVRKIIAKIQMTLQIVLILICVCIHTYFQAKLNSKPSDITIHVRPKLKVIERFLRRTDILCFFIFCQTVLASYMCIAIPVLIKLKIPAQRLVLNW